MNDIYFPETALNYLIERKGADVDQYRQVFRAVKQLEYLRGVFDRFTPSSILDIGCGLAVGSILAARYVSADYLALMDGDGSGDLFSDYREGAPAWNNVAVAGEMARANLPSSCVVSTFVQNPEATIPVDMIVSFKSWATHYPIGEYIPLARRSLKPGGVVVLDLRPGPEDFRLAQVAEMRAAGFHFVEGGDAGREGRRAVFTRVFE